MDLKETHIFEDGLENYWYYEEKASATKDYLKGIKGKNLLDVGSGSGFIAGRVLEADFADNAVCVDIGYDDEKTEQIGGKDIAFVKSIKDKEYKADIALFNDVLEHVEDDTGLLKQYMPHLNDDGYVLITVPAFNFMWSAHDDYVVHYRRYTIKMLEKTVKDAGLEVVKSSYFYASLFPLVFVMRKIDNLKRKFIKTPLKSAVKKHNPLVNSILWKLHAAERKTIFPCNKLYGLTVFCLARKK